MVSNGLNGWRFFLQIFSNNVSINPYHTVVLSKLPLFWSNCDNIDLLFICCVFTVCLMCIWCVFTVYLMCFYCVFDAYSMCIYCIFDVYLICICYVFDVELNLINLKLAKCSSLKCWWNVGAKLNTLILHNLWVLLR